MFTQGRQAKKAIERPCEVAFSIDERATLPGSRAAYDRIVKLFLLRREVRRFDVRQSRHYPPETTLTDHRSGQQANTVGQERRYITDCELSCRRKKQPASSEQ